MKGISCVCVCALVFVCAPCLSLNTSDIFEECFEECTSRVLDGNDFDVACNDTCKVQKCHGGCSWWRNGISSSSCQRACGEERIIMSKKNLDVYCVMGCNVAVSIYISKLKEKLGTPPAPYFLSRTNESVTIGWAPAPLDNISYLVQFRYEALDHSFDWEYYDSSNMLSVNQLTLVGLQPYTKYKFRVAWILLRDVTPLFSKESFVITTLSSGAPSTPPTITCVTAVGPTRISLNWEPPTSPNGPILSYVLYVREHPAGTVIIKDISHVSNSFHYMFNNLKPSTTYIIAVTTRNAFGEGPADTKTISTPARDEFSGSDHPSPFLVFAAKQDVLKKGMHMFDEPYVLYHNENDSILVTGVALHVEKELLFLSDSHGFVQCVNMREKRKETIMKSSSHFPTVLSVDWLNDKLYMVKESQVTRCNFKGEIYEEIVLTDVTCSITDMHADPYNGYLFWTVYDQNMGGIYRIDLADLDYGPKTLKDADKIVNNFKIMSFVVDYKNFRLLFPVPDENTVISSALDGSDAVNIRTNSQTSQFTNVKSIALYNSLFYFTDGVNMFTEEYHEAENKYYHNEFPLRSSLFSSINVCHPHSQPEPVPLNAVEGVQAVFSDKTAKVTWSKPRILGGFGKGAYQKWLYDVLLTDLSTGIEIFENSITKSEYNFKNLIPNTTYSVKIRPYSRSGKGPWSSCFVGRTIKFDNFTDKPFLLYGSKTGLLKSDIMGENMTELIKVDKNAVHITGVSWYKELVFISINSSFINVYDISRNHSYCLCNVTNAASIAIDWFAPKIYYSSPVQQMISRANLDGSQIEPLPILTIAKQLAIDSLAGFIYWVTSHSIESSRLNGDEQFLYMETGLFSGKRVMGLTLDFDKRKIYWAVRNNEGSHLYSSYLADAFSSLESDFSYETLSPFPESDLRGPMSYFSERIFWVHENKGSLVSDIVGHNVAFIHENKMLAVIHSSLQPYPDGFNHDRVRVIPSSVTDIYIVGTWDSFNVTWIPVASTNYGMVFYEVTLDDKNDSFTLVTVDSSFPYPYAGRLKPFSSMTVAVRAYTYWASSRQTVVSVKSPMSTPSKPEDPRIFTVNRSLSPLHNQSSKAIFRWSLPLEPNGIILGYEVTYWMSDEETVRQETVDGTTFEFHISHLTEHATYSFQVRAFTEIGYGEFSEIVNVKASEREHPLPQLLLVKPRAMKLADVDAHKEVLLSNKALNPGAVTYLAHEERVFWSEEDGSLISSYLDGSNITLVRHLASKITSLAVDWIGRVLYWSQVSQDHDSSIWALDLTHQSYCNLILNQSGLITSIAVEPFTSSLLWVVKRKERCELMISSTTGLNIKPVFLNYHAHNSTYSKTSVKDSKESGCNCLQDTLISPTIAIDEINPSAPKIVYADGRLGHIWISDLKGCHCELIFNASQVSQSTGLPPTSLTTDGTRIYWTNETMGKLFSIVNNKKTEASHLHRSFSSADMTVFSSAHKKRHIASETARGIRAIQAIGSYLQPFPDILCLSPLPYAETADLVSRSSTSLTLFLPSYKRPDQCNNISMASVTYSVYYKSLNIRHEINETCFGYIYRVKTNFCEVKTSNNTVVLHGLKPFTNYSIHVAVSNYYNKNFEIGPEAIYVTKEGVPSVPTNVSACAVTPFRIDVSWQPPLFPNGNSITYEVRWRTERERERDSFVQSALYVQGQEKDEDTFLMSIINKEPGTDYHISVRAYSAGRNLYNDSIEVLVTTYNLPGNLALGEVKSNCMTVLWKSPDDHSIMLHTLEYSEADTYVWHSAVKDQQTEPKTMYEFPVYGMKTKTKYNFRLLLTYAAKAVTIQYPEENYFIFETLGSPPSLPGSPEVKHISGDVYQVYWDETDENAGIHLVYELQMKAADDVQGNWSTVYNSSNTQYIVEYVPADVDYIFRVRAINEYGASDFTFSNKSFFFLPEPGAIADSQEEQLGIITASAVATLILLTGLSVVIYLVYKCRESEKKMLHDIVNQNQPSAELELATLQELPQHSNFIHRTNALYSIGEFPVDEELLALPQIQRNQIILTKFLGSGAFGEVFEGIAHDLTEDLPPMKVAVKTLRKGATEHEKEEFLKEAKLMSNFKHDHILQFLGVCFENNPNFIILELMEGGDLLTYLRSNRGCYTSGFQGSSLTFDDLLSICIDVAKGCKYLEDMHFVHRDLAARNCLVSSYDREQRIVKIGDFGLARDIYKNDYYRKEGEGLLPVRWMAPESLMYGIFTTQSDVWAFGVLIWEIMTLGQQPYPARTNIEVLHYVKGGGRLEKPESCPEELHKVMVKCWCYDPDGRPSFGYCLQILEAVRSSAILVQSSFPAVQNQVNLNNAILGIDNLGCSIDDEVEDTELKSTLCSGEYIMATAGINSCEYGDTDGVNDDAFSTKSDPGRSFTTPPFQSNMRRSVSFSYKAQMKASTGSKVTQQFTSAVSKTCFSFCKNYNRYLELLRDNEDTEGYEIPVHAHNMETNERIWSSNKSFLHKQRSDLIGNSYNSITSAVAAPLHVSSYAQVFSISSVQNDRSARSADVLHLKHCEDENSCVGQTECSSLHKSLSDFRCEWKQINSTSAAVPDDIKDDNFMTVNGMRTGSGQWSISTASTVPCDSCTSSQSLINSGISALSTLSETDFNDIHCTFTC